MITEENHIYHPVSKFIFPKEITSSICKSSKLHSHREASFMERVRIFCFKWESWQDL